MQKLGTALMLGMGSGIVYAFLVSTTCAYLKESGLSLAVIGFFSVSTMPFSLKYFWSPFVDHYKLKIFPDNFGQRKSCIILMQMFLFVAIFGFGFIDLVEHQAWALLLLVIIGFLGATSDIALEAYRIELFSKEESGIGNGFVIYGFRIGFIVSGIFGLWLSTILPWRNVFMILALFILPCTTVIALSPDKKVLRDKPKRTTYGKWLKSYFLEPIVSLIQMPKFIWIMVVIAFFKVGDAYLDTMSLPFLMEIGFSKSEIAGVAKTCSTVGAVFGTFIGSVLISKFHFKVMLLAAEILAAITNLQFLILLKVQKNLLILGAINFVESFCYGISNIALITYMSSFCSKKFTATHFAILLSISALSKALLSPTSGVVAQNFGWQNFFVISSLFSIPSLLCIYLIYWRNNKTNLPYK
ncbi:MFS transporter [Candidatus Bandiella euplotis]|uniref:MFS transporter n=1 Tax=Candidatus Bandiella euplotis TaxID=1664265 RepID=UPI002B25A4C5|nr:MFS transporter [Candidatus Bandiella woodruffii]